MSRKIFLLWTESPNDHQVVSELIQKIADGRINCVFRKISSPIILPDKADQKKRGRMMRLISEVYNENNKKDVCIVVIHRDTDAPEPSHVESRARWASDLDAEGIRAKVLAIPAPEIEAWLLRFPDAVAKARTSWRSYRFRIGSNVTVSDAKRILKSEINKCQSSAGRSVPYTESIGVDIARYVDRNDLLGESRYSSSLAFFVRDAVVACQPDSK